MFLSANASELLALACRTCRIQYDGKLLHSLLCLLHCNVVSLCRGFVTTELVSLQEEEAARYWMLTGRKNGFM